MKQIKPQALKGLREQKKWTKAELSRQSGVKPRRLIELENEEADFHSIRESSFEGLCKALGATEAQLRGEEPITDALPVNYVTLRSKITTVAQMNYDLIGAQYGLTSDQLVQLAPLMFAILVEESFKWRSEQLELRKQMLALKKQLAETIYDPYAELYEDKDEDFLIQREEAAINGRSVFTRPQDAKLDSEFLQDSDFEEHPDNYFTDRFTDFVAAKVKSENSKIRLDLAYDWTEGRDIQNPENRYIAVSDLFDYLTDAEDENAIAEQRLSLLSGAIRLDSSGLNEKINGREALKAWFKMKLKSSDLDIININTKVEPGVVYREIRGEDEGKMLGLDDLGFPVILEGSRLFLRKNNRDEEV